MTAERPPPGRVLGIDHGERRIGLAVSDELRLVAHGLPTLMRKSPEEDLAYLLTLIAEKNVREIVVGLPRNLDNTLGPEAEKVLAFRAWLAEKTGLPVHLFDERLTTKRVERLLAESGLSREKRRRRVDRMAAQTILQAYLDLVARRDHARDERS